MFKTAAATILSATLALGALVPAPAQAADSGEVARFLFGAATLAIIANELNDRKRSEPSSNRAIQGNVVGRHNNNSYNDNVIRPRQGNVITPHRQNRARVVPANCQRTIETGNGNRRLYGVPCLRREGVNVARLPQNCLRTVELPRRTVNAFAQRCLRREGVRIVN